MKILEADGFGFSAPEVAIMHVDHVPEYSGEDQLPKAHREWSHQVGSMDLEQVFGNLAVGVDLVEHPDRNVSYTMRRVPSEGVSRDWWAGDHFWHVDGTRWDTQPVFTVIGCSKVEQGAPQTQLLDTVELLAMTLDNGFWADHGLDEHDLDEMTGVFQDTTYYRQAMPFLDKFMKSWEKARYERIIAETVEKQGFKTPEEYFDNMDEEYPPKTFDLIQRTPLSNKKSLFIDGGGRQSQLLGPDGSDMTQVLHDLRWEYLANEERLRRNGLIKTIGWEANRAIIFPQIGTLHRAGAGNDHERELQLVFLAEAAA
jgi:alpha-ketoglutarate-dependent taurine dioxygenase